MAYWNPDNMHDDPIMTDELVKIQRKYGKKSKEWTCQVYKEKFGINYNIKYVRPLLIWFIDWHLKFKMVLRDEKWNTIWCVVFFDYEIEKISSFLLSWDLNDVPEDFIKDYKPLISWVFFA